MGYDLRDSFTFDFEPNGIPFGSKLKRKLSTRSYPIQCERKWKYSVLRVYENKEIHPPRRIRCLKVKQEEISASDLDGVCSPIISLQFLLFKN